MSQHGLNTGPHLALSIRIQDTQLSLLVISYNVNFKHNWIPPPPPPPPSILSPWHIHMRILCLILKSIFNVYGYILSEIECPKLYKVLPKFWHPPPKSLVSHMITHSLAPNRCCYFQQIPDWLYNFKSKHEYCFDWKNLIYWYYHVIYRVYAWTEPMSIVF